MNASLQALHSSQIGPVRLGWGRRWDSVLQVGIPPRQYGMPTLCAMHEEGMRKSDYEVIQGHLSGCSASRAELGTRLAFVRSITRRRNARLPKPLEPNQVDELCQEVVATVLANLGNFKQGAKLQPWAEGILANIFFQHFDRTRRWRFLLSDVAANTDEQSYYEPLPGESDEFWSVLEDLPELEHKTLMLCRVEGLSHGQVADLLQEPVGTTKSRYQRTIKKLQVRLSRYWINENERAGN